MWWRKQYIFLRCLYFSVCLIISTNQIMKSRLSVLMYYKFLGSFLLFTVLFVGTFVIYIKKRKKTRICLKYLVNEIEADKTSVKTSSLLYIRLYICTLLKVPRKNWINSYHGMSCTDIFFWWCSFIIEIISDFIFKAPYFTWYIFVFINYFCIKFFS